MKRISTWFPKSVRKADWMRIFAVLFWLLLWQLGSAAVKQEILLVSPVSACRALIRLMGEKSFYFAVLGSFGRILLGFFLSALLAVGLSALSRASFFVRTLVAPLMAVIKATPVASFVILALIWISSKNLSVFIAFLMVLPIIYGNVLSGLDAADPKLLEMAKVFKVGRWRRVRAIYIPAAFPYLLSSIKISLGMCWKAGIAAEVIAQPKNSIGAALSRAKLFFETPELFAWTLAIIVLSVLFERAVVWAISAINRKTEGDSCAH